MINYHNKTFRPVQTSQTSEVNDETVFLYEQEGHIVSATYSGGAILFGHLIALVDDDGVLNMRYHHINSNGDLQTGLCISTPEILPDGKLRLHEKWKWTSGTKTEGESVLEEIQS